MPPRMKHAAKRGSSSFDKNRFWRKEAEEAYLGFWGDKSVVTERQWNLDHFKGEDFLWQQNFEGRNWVSITRFHPLCIAEVVREFFANIKEDRISIRRGRESIASFVRGVELEITPNDFALLFSLGRPQNAEFSYPFQGSPTLEEVVAEVLVPGTVWPEGGQVKVSHVNDRYWPLHMFSCSSLLPLSRNSECSEKRARLLHAIGTGMTMDLPLYMWSQLVECFEHSTAQAGIPFGGALTQLFRLKRVQIPPELHCLPVLQPLNYASFTKSRGPQLQPKKRKTPVSASEPGSSSRAAQSEETSMEQLATMLQNQGLAISRLEEGMGEIHGILEDQRRAQEEQNRMFQHFFSQFPGYMPPPPPPQ